MPELSGPSVLYHCAPDVMQPELIQNVEECSAKCASLCGTFLGPDDFLPILWLARLNSEPSTRVHVSQHRNKLGRSTFSDVFCSLNQDGCSHHVRHTKVLQPCVKHVLVAVLCAGSVVEKRRIESSFRCTPATFLANTILGCRSGEGFSVDIATPRSQSSHSWRDQLLQIGQFPQGQEIEHLH